MFIVDQDSVEATPNRGVGRRFLGNTMNSIVVIVYMADTIGRRLWFESRHKNVDIPALLPTVAR